MGSTLVDEFRRAQDTMISTTRTLCDINSGSHNPEGLRSVAEGLKALYRDVFAEVEEVALAPIERVEPTGEIREVAVEPSLVFRRNPNAPIQLLCTGHYDTVFPENSDFQQTWIEGDHLRGPGVADMKGGLVILKHALEYTFAQPYAERIGVTLVVSPDEEIGSPSSAAVLTDLAKNADYGLTYEPALADGTLAGARKGSGNFSIVIKGKAAHAGREFFNGRNAIVSAARVASELAKLSCADSGLTVNIGAIDGGGPVNVVPDTAVIRFNIRIEDATQMAVTDEITALLAAEASASGCEISLHGHFNRPPKPMTERQEWMFQLLKSVGNDLGIGIDWKPTGGCCEGNNLAAAGLINIDTLGVRGGAIHSDGEFAVMSSFPERAALSAALIQRLAEMNKEESACS